MEHQACKTFPCTVAGQMHLKQECQEAPTSASENTGPVLLSSAAVSLFPFHGSLTEHVFC